MQAKKKPIERLSLVDLGLDPDDARPTQRSMRSSSGGQGAGEIIEDARRGPRPHRPIPSGSQGGLSVTAIWVYAHIQRGRR